MKAGLVEEDVMLLMIDLQQLARLLCTLGRETLDPELRLLGGLEMDPGSRSHVSGYTLTSKASSSIYSSL
jgi:hypothetical protein